MVGSALPGPNRPGLIEAYETPTPAAISRSPFRGLIAPASLKLDGGSRRDGSCQLALPGPNRPGLIEANVNPIRRIPMKGPSGA